MPFHRRQWREPALRACRRERAFGRAAARTRRHAEFVGRGGAAACRTLSRAALRPARLRPFGKSAAGIHQRRAGRGFRSACRAPSASIRPIISSPSPPPPRRRCAFWKSIPTRSARWCCAIRRRASIRAAPRRSTSAPRSPCARACAPRCRRRSHISYPVDARRARRLRGLSRPLSGQRSGRLRLRLPRAGAHQHAAHAAADPLPDHGGGRPPRYRAAARRHGRTCEKDSRRAFRADRGRPLHADAGAASRSLRCSKIF